MTGGWRLSDISQPGTGSAAISPGSAPRPCFLYEVCPPARTAVRLPHVPLPRTKAGGVAFLVKADPPQHHVELATVHGLERRVEVQ